MASNFTNLTIIEANSAHSNAEFNTVTYTTGFSWGLVAVLFAASIVYRGKIGAGYGVDFRLMICAVTLFCALVLLTAVVIPAFLPDGDSTWSFGPWAYSLIYWPYLALVTLSTLFSYVHLFSCRRSIKVICWCLMMLTSLVCVAGTLLNGIMQNDGVFFTNPTKYHETYSFHRVTWVTVMATDDFIEIMLLLLPVYPTLKAPLSMHAKAFAVLIFLAGLCTIGCAGLRIYYCWNGDLQNAIIWLNLHGCMFIFTVSFPFLYPFIKDVAKCILKCSTRLLSRCTRPRSFIRFRPSPAIPMSPFAPHRCPGVQPAPSNDSMGSEAGLVDHGAAPGQQSIPLQDLFGYLSRVPGATGERFTPTEIEALTPTEAVTAQRQWAKACNSMDRDSVGTTRARYEGYRIKGMGDIV